MEERRLSTTGESLYLTLGLTRTATMEEVRRAYRRQALLYHPDKNPGDPAAAERFQELNRAYAVLIDPRSRQVYDRHGSMGVSVWEDLQQHQANRLILDTMASGWCKCLALVFGLLTCCYCCCCCCCCCNFCCGRYKPDTDKGAYGSFANQPINITASLVTLQPVPGDRPSTNPQT